MIRALIFRVSSSLPPCAKVSLLLGLLHILSCPYVRLEWLCLLPTSAYAEGRIGGSREIERGVNNIILFLGDGMGFEQVQAGRCYAGMPLSFEEFPYQGLLTTYSASSLVTDSAAAATAIATGMKVNNGVISLQLPGNGRELQTLLEYYKSKGRVVGLVTTAYMTHASPAAFGAHESSRTLVEHIAHDYLYQTMPELLLGGGGNGMGSALAEDRGYTVVTTLKQMTKAPISLTRLSGQFGSTHLPFEYDGLGSMPHLSQMTKKALSFLANKGSGFFLFVEGGRIDHAGEANDIARLVPEVIELSHAVDVAKQWALGRNDTLVIVLADHETGGLTVEGNCRAGIVPEVSWQTKDHTGADVGVFAWGFGAHRFAAQLDNTAISGLIKKAGVVPRFPGNTASDFNGDSRADSLVLRAQPSGDGLVGYLRYSGSEGTSLFEQVFSLHEFRDETSKQYLHGDMDGDGNEDLVQVSADPSGYLLWRIRKSSTLEIEYRYWGEVQDIPVVADFDGDGRGDLGVYRPHDGSWWLWRSTLSYVTLRWGLEGDIPVPADYDGDGWDDVAVWRPSSGYWAVLQSSKGASTKPEDYLWIQFGLDGDIPLPGDYDGDSRSDLVVYRPSASTWYRCSSVNRFNCQEEAMALSFGLQGDQAIPADYDGDGIIDIAVRRPGESVWFVLGSKLGKLLAWQWGLEGDILVP